MLIGFDIIVQSIGSETKWINEPLAAEANQRSVRASQIQGARLPPPQSSPSETGVFTFGAKVS